MPNGKKILIVDDEVSFLSLLKNTLELRGFEVVTVTDAVEAGIELATNLPTLILLDIKMPGINGFQACEAIKKNPATKDLPIIIVSALADEASMKKAYKLGVSGYFVKPVDIEALIKKIKEIIGS